jgi:hypothetical protein
LKNISGNGDVVWTGETWLERAKLADRLAKMLREGLLCLSFDDRVSPVLTFVLW